MVAAGAALATGALAAAVLVSAGARRSTRGAPRLRAIARGLRRGAMVGCIVALGIVLRALDGLTPLTVLFVVAPFVVAEAMLSTRRV